MFVLLTFAVAVGIAVSRRAAVFLRAQQAGCVGAGIAVGVYKSAGCRVVVTALEVVERQGQRSDLTSTPPEPRLKGSQFYGEIHGLKKRRGRKRTRRRCDRTGHRQCQWSQDRASGGFSVEQRLLKIRYERSMGYVHCE